jgi:hypothetical protein
MSPSRMSRSHRVGVVLTAILAAGSALMVTGAVVARMLVPYAIDGHVARLNERNHNSGGSDVWLLELEDGRNYFLDEVGARTITVGSDISKDAWSRTIEVDGDPRRVGLSHESTGPIVWAITIGAVSVGVAAVKPRSRREATPRPPEPAASS